MPRDSYQDALSSLRDDVLYMSEVVAERLRMGLDALEQKDDQLAEEVIEGDGEINRMYLDLEQDCIDLIALQQPVASDLRFIAASFKIITDLERIGDVATNLGEYSLEADRECIAGRHTGRCRRDDRDGENAMDAYGSEDADQCYTIADIDDEVDERVKPPPRWSFVTSSSAKSTPTPAKPKSSN